MTKKGRTSVEETIIEAALGEKELELLLIGFLEALEKEQRLDLGKSDTPAPAAAIKGKTA